MSRVKISEYRAKSILLGDAYKGIQLRSGAEMEVPEGAWVAKVDQGIKKRFKQGLVSINKPAEEMLAAIKSWEENGFTQFILEPLFPHEASEEQYFSLERIREGVRMLHTKDGGVDIEAHPEAVQTYIVKSSADIAAVAAQSSLPEAFLKNVFEAFDTHHFAFLEINPLVIQEGSAHLLDAAVLVDSAASFFVRSWTEDDVIKARAKHPAEGRVEVVAATTPASLKLSVIDPNGALFFLLSGGGGSIGWSQVGSRLRRRKPSTVTRHSFTAALK